MLEGVTILPALHGSFLQEWGLDTILILGEMHQHRLNRGIDCKGTHQLSSSANRTKSPFRALCFSRMRVPVSPDRASMTASLSPARQRSLHLASAPVPYPEFDIPKVGPSNMSCLASFQSEIILQASLTHAASLLPYPG